MKNQGKLSPPASSNFTVYSFIIALMIEMVLLTMYPIHYIILCNMAGAICIGLIHGILKPPNQPTIESRIINPINRQTARVLPTRGEIRQFYNIHNVRPQIIAGLVQSVINYQMRHGRGRGNTHHTPSLPQAGQPVIFSMAQLLANQPRIQAGRGRGSLRPRQE